MEVQLGYHKFHWLRIPVLEISAGFFTYNLYFEGDNRLVQVPGQLIYCSSGPVPEGLYSLASVFQSVYGTHAVMPFQYNARGTDTLKPTERTVFPDGADIHFFPHVNGARCLLTKYAREDARLSISDMANQRSIKGVIARVPDEAAGPGHTALSLELYHQDQGVLNRFLEDVCDNGVGQPRAEIVGLLRGVGYQSLHKQHFAVRGGGPRREDSKLSGCSTGGYSLASPTDFHFAMYS